MLTTWSHAFSHTIYSTTSMRKGLVVTNEVPGRGPLRLRAPKSGSRSESKSEVASVSLSVAPRRCAKVGPILSDIGPGASGCDAKGLLVSRKPGIYWVSIGYRMRCFGLIGPILKKILSFRDRILAWTFVAGCGRGQFFVVFGQKVRKKCRFGAERAQNGDSGILFVTGYRGGWRRRRHGRSGSTFRGGSGKARCDVRWGQG